MSIESLKQQARRHEQGEEWQKALDQYEKAIRALAEDDQTDIGLINRVGDLFVRVGGFDDAVKHYEEAVDLYREAYLPNNAIAVCKKIIRNVPGRHHACLKMGQIRAEQGFLSDARTNFLTYAERMQQAGDLDESFRALVEFCDLAPDDVQVRITVADQMVASDRTQEAVEQLLLAYSRLTQSGEGDLAAGVEKKINELDPDVDVDVAAASSGFGSAAGDDVLGSSFADIELGDDSEPEPEADAAGEEEGLAALGGFEINSSEGEAVTESLEDALEEEASELPITGFEDLDNEEDEVADELPMIGFGDDDDKDDEGEAFELPTMDFGGDSDQSGALDDAAAGLRDAAGDVVERALDADDSVESHLPSADVVAEAIEEAAPEVEASLPPAPPVPAEAPPAPAEPAAPAQDFVDFGAMILGGGDEKQKSTRFQVAYEEPTGDEDADFAKMLSQFKDKVSENLDAGDVQAHYDLGTAYKEMGLLEEAISSFQQALRASADHLPTYEVMGQTFIEMGQPEAAVRSLQRALEITAGVEDEFVGIYYYLARAFEALARKDSAIEYYDRVFALDINFADVTERLRELR